MRSLYFYQDHGIPMGFGIKPAFDEDRNIYDSLTRTISLKDDLDWHERRNLQNVLAKADWWGDFPFESCQLIAAEVYLGKYKQRIDLLYLHTSGAIQVCELKLGGESLDIVGQLLRYLGELAEKEVDLNWVRQTAAKFRRVELGSFDYKFDRHCRKLEEFIEDHRITDVTVDRDNAAYIDESPDRRALVATRELNGKGYAIRAYSLAMLVAEEWRSEDLVQYMKLNIEQLDIDRELSS